VEERDRKVLNQILASYDYDKTDLIAILQQIQHEYSYLPRQALEYIAKELRISPVKIYSVATFYNSFSLEPKG